MSGIELGTAACEAVTLPLRHGGGRVGDALYNVGRRYVR